MPAFATMPALLLAVLAAAAIHGALGHGWLQAPIARNWLVAGQRQKNFQGEFYSPMSLNRPGRPTRGATCGGQYTGDSRFEVGGQFARRKIVATYRSGQAIRTQFQIINNHWGYLQFRLCPLKGTSNAAEKASLSASCLAKHPLRLKGNGSQKLWLYSGAPGSRYMLTSTWVLPKGVRCSRCVLQVTYVTGHMCYLPGVDKNRMLKVQPGGNENCPKSYLGLNSLPSEKFWNCADIRIT